MNLIFGDITPYYILVGIVSLLIAIGFLWVLYHIIRFVKAKADIEETYAFLECGYIRKVAENNKINLNKEKYELRIFKPIKSFRTQIEQKIIKEMIGEIKEKEKKQHE